MKPGTLDHYRDAFRDAVKRYPDKAGFYSRAECEAHLSEFGPRHECGQSAYLDGPACEHCHREVMRNFWTAALEAAP